MDILLYPFIILNLCPPANLQDTNMPFIDSYHCCYHCSTSNFEIQIDIVGPISFLCIALCHQLQVQIDKMGPSFFNTIKKNLPLHTLPHRRKQRELHLSQSFHLWCSWKQIPKWQIWI